MDESGVEPETFRMLSERATNYATRPYWMFNLKPQEPFLSYRNKQTI